MLLQRVITAVLLLLVLVPAMLASDATVFCGLTLLFVSAGAWEWARLSGLGQMPALAAGASTAALCMLLWIAGWLHATPALVWLGTTLLWVLGGGWLLAGGVGRWSALPRGLRLGLGVVLLSLAWLAIARARVVGVNFLLSVLLLVWVADIGAYFAGRSLGGRWITRRLAPSISPGKTWEGSLGGLVGVVVLALLWRVADPHLRASSGSIYSVLGAAGALVFVLGVAWLTLMSVVGDLIESLVKRAAGAKDSSALLPGHGGVLDRIDALLPTLPLALFLQSRLGAA